MAAAQSAADESDKSDQSDRSDLLGLKTTSAERCANTMICLVNQASYLLARQLRRLEQDFLSEGGFTERLYQQRREQRAANTPAIQRRQR